MDCDALCALVHEVEHTPPAARERALLSRAEPSGNTLLCRGRALPSRGDDSRLALAELSSHMSIHSDMVELL